ALGLTGFDMGAWIGVMLPGGTPKSIVEQMAAIIEKSMQNPEVKKTFATISVEPEFKGPAELAAYMKAYSAKMSDVIKRNQIKVS
ncbi:MAG: tripartite tricarboxylate transporter substrate binding protein, partial [Betaproteobacteria bacterium]|nr:tripartite tricarboxylate transporter substrate binding protein [Betaproteobacteria bacterium]